MYPFFGHGAAFPFRIDPSVGGIQITQGVTDSVSVALQYLQENWTIRENINYVANHIAEAIAHILLTIPKEHDTLPEFGSRVMNILFEPNTQEFRLTAKVYMETSTVRWEKRAKLEDTQWYVDGILVDRGELPCFSRVEFIVQQAPGNLVAPLVTDRQARLQEYPSAVIDKNSHDIYSRYYNRVPVSRDGCNYIRLRNCELKFNPAFDDMFYRVALLDTWLLVSWANYSDIRFWNIVAKNYINDRADHSRDILSACTEPQVGEVIRLPSKSRLLQRLAASR